MEILLLTAAAASHAVLPALDLLPHTIRTAPRDVRALVSGPSPDVILLDARCELAEARASCRMLRATGSGVPLIAIVTEAGLIAINADWGLDDLVLAGAGPAEVEARLRLAVGRLASAAAATGGLVKAGELSIDPDTYAAKLKGRPLDLTYKEFELLKFLAQHPGRVFTRDQLLREVWGYDYFGGTRTVDVHVRRLRAKLGSEYESMIGTVRQVGYKFVVPPNRPLADDKQQRSLPDQRERALADERAKSLALAPLPGAPRGNTPSGRPTRRDADAAPPSSPGGQHAAPPPENAPARGVRRLA